MATYLWQPVFRSNCRRHHRCVQDPNSSAQPLIRWNPFTMPIHILAPPRVVSCGAILLVARLPPARVRWRSGSFSPVNSTAGRRSGDGHCYMRRIKARRDMAAVPSSLLVLRIPARPTSTSASEAGPAICVLRPARSHPLTWAWARIPEDAKALA